jgi:hypothetical protein
MAHAGILPDRPGVFGLLADAVQGSTVPCEAVPAPRFAPFARRVRAGPFSNIADVSALCRFFVNRRQCQLSLVLPLHFESHQEDHTSIPQ